MKSQVRSSESQGEIENSLVISFYRLFEFSQYFHVRMFIQVQFDGSIINIARLWPFKRQELEHNEIEKNQILHCSISRMSNPFPASQIMYCQTAAS